MKDMGQINKTTEFMAKLKTLFDEYEIQVEQWSSYDQEENACGDNYALRSRRLDYGINIDITELMEL